MNIRRGFAIEMVLIGGLAAVFPACAPQPPEQRPAEAVKRPLASWNDGVSRQAIVDFVGRVTDPASPNHVPEPERIAVFDNDGTLWSERPVYFQLLFAIDRVKAVAADHPEWATQQPFQAVLKGDMEALTASGERGLLELVMATHAGMTTDEFEAIVRDWIETARHPTTGRPYTDMVRWRYRVHAPVG
jgi:hypothetical protein